jgi:serine/threonine protein kinase/Tol biopolymer transport system component
VIGQTTAHYKILEKLGEGGMGVVYKAEDTKLDRLVALKFLPPHLAASQQDKARFIQEAKAASAINHPNICTIYSIDEHEEQLFIVMEFVDGQTLRQKQGTIGYKQAIDIGIQIADGLAAAHEKGIVHRDLKPENIMIRRDGIAQIMDFGLAKLRASGSKITRLTKEGSTVGTAGYMSPEQVQGQDTDHRSDIFSYGVLLYELLTGQLPFKGVHDTALAYEIVNVDPPPMSAVKPEVDPSLDAIVLECLEKDVNERAQGIKQISVDLKRFKRESSRQRASRVTAARPAYAPSAGMPEGSPHLRAGSSPQRFVPWAVALVCFVAAAVLGVLLVRSSPGERATIRASILPPDHEKFHFFGNTSGPPALSPDGKRMVFVAKDSADRQMLFVRALGESEAHPLAGSERAVHPFWSPDNRFVGFTAQGKLKKIDASGGPPIVICDAVDSRGGSWGPDGVIVFSPGPSQPIFAVPASGGTRSQITGMDSLRKETTHRWPFFLPDGKHFLYYARTTTTGAQGEGDAIRIASIDGKVNKVLLSVSSNAVYASGHLLYARGNSLVAQRFNTSTLELEGDAAVLVQDIAFDPSISRGLFSASDNGLLIYQTGTVRVGSMFSLVDRGGKPLSVIGDIGEYLAFRISSDSKRIAVGVFDQKFRNNDVWLFEINRGLKTRFTFDPAAENNPVWSPDGARVVFSSNRQGKNDLYVKSSSGAANEELLYASTESSIPNDWSPDGKSIVYNVTGASADIWILPVEATGQRSKQGPFPFLATEFVEGQARFSPDGKWIAYTSNESGQWEVYLRPFPGPGGKFQVSTEGGRNPVWRRDGKELFYIGVNDTKLMGAGISVNGSSVEVNNVHPLFTMTGTDYDVMADGRLILNVPLQTQLSSPLTLVSNWESALEKK